MRPFGLREQGDMQDAINTFGQLVTVVDEARSIRARVRFLNAGELVDCMELYNVVVTVAARDFPDHPPRKGMIFQINGVRRGVVEVLERKPSGRLVGWQLGCKG